MNPLAIVVLAVEGCVAAITFAEKFIGDPKVKGILNDIVQALNAVMVILGGHAQAPQVKVGSLVTNFLETNKHLVVADAGATPATCSEEQHQEAKAAIAKVNEKVSEAEAAPAV